MLRMIPVPVLFVAVACTPVRLQDQKTLSEHLDQQQENQQRLKKLTRRREEDSGSSDKTGTDKDRTKESGRSQKKKKKNKFPLALEEAVRMALGENQEIQIESLSPPIARAAAQQAVGTFDPEVYADVERTDNRQPTGTTLSGAPELRTEKQSQRAGFRGTSPIGLEYNLFYELVRDESNSRFRIVDPQYQGVLGVTITQPLLRGFGPDAQLAEYRAQLNRLTKQQFQTLSTMNEQIYSVHRAYWNLVRAEEERRIAKNALELARKTVNVNRAKYEADQVPEVDLLQARTQLTERREQLEIRKNDVRDARDRLIQLVSPPGTKSKDWELDLITKTEPDTTPINLRKEDELIDLAMETRMDVKAIEKEMDALDELLKQRRNQVKPNLDLELSYRRNSLGEDATSSIEQIRDENFRTWSAGLLFSYPLWNRTRSGRKRELQLKRRRLSLQRRKLQTTVAREVRSGIRRVRSAKNRMEIARKSEDLAEKQLTAETARQEAGLSTTFRVLRLQDDVRRAQSRFVKARVDYAKAYAELQKALGMLVSKYME